MKDEGARDGQRGGMKIVERQRGQGTREILSLVQIKKMNSNKE